MFYIWFLPLLWSLITTLSFFHSGDEHALFAFGGIAGTWIGFFHQFDTLGDALFPVLLVGAATLGFTGFIMDRLRVSKALFGALLALGVIVFFCLSLAKYASFQRMAAKHRSVLAVVIFDCNWSLYGTIVLSCLISGARTLWQLTRRTQPPS